MQKKRIKIKWGFSEKIEIISKRNSNDPKKREMQNRGKIKRNI